MTPSIDSAADLETGPAAGTAIAVPGGPVPAESATFAARTLPASWYADPEQHRRQLDAVFRRGWSCVGVVDDLAPSNGYLAVTTPDGTPVLVTTDAAGTMRAFLNVCRHRGAPLAEGCGTARALSCPYHAWVYRLDGGLARHHGMEGADGLRPARPLAAPRLGRHLGAVRVRQPPARRSPVRPRPAGRGPRPLRRRHLHRGRPGVDRAGLQLEGAGRELLGELPHAVGAPRADRARMGLPHRERRRRVAGLGPPPAAPEPHRGGAGHGAAGRRGLARGRQRPDRRRCSSPASTSPCGPTCW